jgi:hypothetical protein
MTTPPQLPPDPEPLHQGPIWAPTPGVPVVARILAYTFAALLTLAVLMSFLVRRPPDLPVPPAKWDQYKSTMGYVLPYPAEWVKQGPVKKQEWNGELVQFFMPTIGNPLTALFCLAIDVDANTEDQNIARELATQLGAVREKRFTTAGSNAFTGYLTNDAPDADPAGLHTFTFRTTRRGQAMTGAWCLLRRGHRFVYLEGMAPAAGKGVMDAMVTQIAKATAL